MYVLLTVVNAHVREKVGGREGVEKKKKKKSRYFRCLFVCLLISRTIEGERASCGRR